MAIRSQTSLIMGLIGPERPELFALELKNAIFLFAYPLASTNINQSAPNLVKIYMTIKSWVNSILGLTEPLIEILTAFSVCLEYNFVIYSLNIFKSNMCDC